MRIGGLLSLALHVGFAAAGMFVMSHSSSRDETPLIMLPVELLEISDTTNVIPLSESVKEEDTPEMAQPEPASAAPPPPPDESEEVIPDRTKPEPKATPTPAKQPEKKMTFEEERRAALEGVDRNYKDPTAGTAPSKGGAANTEDGKPRPTVGNARQMTITVAAYIKQQLVTRGCWTSQADMADAQRLGVVFAVSFKRDGTLAAEPKMIEPRSVPVGDPVLQTYILRARNALLKCNIPRYDVPKQYFEHNPPETIELDFRAGK